VVDCDLLGPRTLRHACIETACRTLGGQGTWADSPLQSCNANNARIRTMGDGRSNLRKRQVTYLSPILHVAVTVRIEPGIDREQLNEHQTTEPKSPDASQFLAFRFCRYRRKGLAFEKASRSLHTEGGGCTLSVSRKVRKEITDGLAIESPGSRRLLHPCLAENCAKRSNYFAGV
jgi:hypothetical protein